MDRSLSSVQSVRALVAMLAAIATWSMLPAVAHAAFPGTNGKLAFGSARSGYPADNDLYTMASNGTAETRITSMSRDELNPSWSPSGAEIVFERNNGMRSDIWIANADGSNPRQLTTHAGNDTRPAFSNTGTKIVFASDRNSTHGISDLFVMDANGANQVAITNTPTIDESYPVLVARRDRDRVLARRRHLQGLAQRRQPDARDDQSRSRSSSRTGLRTAARSSSVRASTPTTSSGRSTRTEPARSTPLAQNGSVVEEHPVWSPQGDKIAFIRGAFEDAEVYTMNADGSGVTRITNNTVMDASPAWQVSTTDRRHLRLRRRHLRHPRTRAHVRVPSLLGLERRRALALGRDGSAARGTGCFRGGEGTARTLDPTRCPLVDDLSRAVLLRRSPAPVNKGAGTVLGPHVGRGNKAGDREARQAGKPHFAAKTTAEAHGVGRGPRGDRRPVAEATAQPSGPVR